MDSISLVKEGGEIIINFYRMRQLIHKLPFAYTDWQDACGGYIGSPIITDMPHGHDVGNPVERAAVKAQRMYDAYRQVLDELTTMRNELKPLIDRLPDEVDRALMRLRYLDGYSAQVIVDSSLFCMSVTAVYNHLRHAERVINCWQHGQNG